MKNVVVPVVRVINGSMKNLGISILNNGKENIKASYSEKLLKKIKTPSTKVICILINIE